MSWGNEPDDFQDGYQFDPQKRNGNTGFLPPGIADGGFAGSGDWQNLSKQAATPAAPQQPTAALSGDWQNLSKQAATPATPAGWDRTGFRDAWMGTGNNVAAQDALLKQYGINLSGNGTGTL